MRRQGRVKRCRKRGRRAGKKHNHSRKALRKKRLERAGVKDTAGVLGYHWLKTKHGWRYMFGKVSSYESRHPRIPKALA